MRPRFLEAKSHNPEPHICLLSKKFLQVDGALPTKKKGWVEEDMDGSNTDIDLKKR